MHNHCDQPGICYGPLGCNCGCYICDGGPERGLTIDEWRQEVKNKILHFKKMLADGVSDEDDYSIRQRLWVIKIMLPQEELDIMFPKGE